MVTLEYVSRVSSCGLVAMACAHPWGSGTIHVAREGMRQKGYGFVECFATHCIYTSLAVRQWIPSTNEFFGAGVDVHDGGAVTIGASHLPPPPAIGVTW